MTSAQAAGEGPDAAALDRWWALLLALAEHPTPARPEEPVAACWVDGRVSVGPLDAQSFGSAGLVCSGTGAFRMVGTPPPGAAELVELYGPLCAPGRDPWVVAHLAQSLDGRIAPPDGSPEDITGAADRTHNHRLRALADAVLVGAATVFHDDPQLNVRLCAGKDPVRVVLLGSRELSCHYRVFSSPCPPTLLVCARTGVADPHGHARVLELAPDAGPREVLDALRARGYGRVFVEGGGVTVSRFFEAGCLTRLQIAVSPLILGCGRPGLELSRVARTRLRCRRHMLDGDVLFDCEIAPEAGAPACGADRSPRAAPVRQEDPET